MATNVKPVIQWLEDNPDLDDAEIAQHPELAALLHPVRSHRPLPYVCSSDKCKITLAFWALGGDGARIIPGPKRRKATSRSQAGTYQTEPQPWGQSDSFTLGGSADLEFPDLRHEGRFDQATEWADSDQQSAIAVVPNPGVASPYPLRWSFTCPRCDAHYPYTNRQMLTLFLRAILYQRGEIRPGIL